ncbi:MAG: phospholipase D-like domain-containing protein [Gammaproteobacteria bacterium]|nr:phospholipase D-like domain-containing protein [Gammaproteobacteria bacterium]
MEDFPGYHAVVNEQFQKARRVNLAISYIQQSGVSVLKEFIEKIGRNVHLVCSFDMEITDPLAIKQLLDMGVTVKVYQARRGTFHTKLWLFECAGGRWNCIVGSANLSANALRENVEVGVLIKEDDNQEAVHEALKIFRFMWVNENCCNVTYEDIDAWAKEREKRKKIESHLKRKETRSSSPVEDVAILEEFVKGWIDIGVGEQTRGQGIKGRLWRGWYIIPDQGHVDDDMIDRLQKICKIISAEEEKTIDISPRRSAPLGRILNITREKLVRPSHRMDLRGLFIRQEKNYLIHFGFAVHPEKPNGKPDKDLLRLTELGERFSFAKEANERKEVYTEAVQEYSYNNLPLLEFTYKLLEQVERLSFIEFSFFVNHTYSFNDIDSVAKLIDIYRGLSSDNQRRFQDEMNAYFSEKLEPTASNVKGNYEKKVRHTMSALGWCKRLQFDLQNKELRLVE